MIKDRSIYICDDHRLFLESIEIYFGLKDGYHCIGHAEDSNKAIADILLHKPDIILIDYHLKNENGLDLLQKINSKIHLIPNKERTKNQAGFDAELRLISK
jgi:DNA-binding NarL/FixJ family response regulator